MHITRRYFLQTTGALAAYVGVTPLTGLIGSASANPVSVTKGKTLVVVFLRGGIDGLNLIVPYADPHYADLRKAYLARALRPGEENGAVDLERDVLWAEPGGPLRSMPFFDRRGRSWPLHAVGYDPNNSRSHFEEQDIWETGVIGNTVELRRMAEPPPADQSEGRGPIRAVALGDTLPRILRGEATAYAVRGLSDLGLPQPRGGADAVAAALEHAYQCEPMRAAPDARDLVTQTGDATLDGIATIRKLMAAEYQPAADYPAKNALGERLAAAARLIKSDIGVEVISIDYGGWDTHNNQGNGIEGNYANKVQQLAEAMNAFATDLGDRLNDTLVLTLSDFGRTARENGTRGTDHGWANAMLAMGGPVMKTGDKAGIGSDQRRKVLADWPGLAEDQLNAKRDLLHTTDFRDVLAEVVQTHLGNTNLPAVLPDHTFKPVGLVA